MAKLLSKTAAIESIRVYPSEEPPYLMRIGITYNLKSDVPRSPSESFPADLAEEFDSPETIEAIRGVLSKEGHEVHLLGGDLETLEKIKRAKVEFVFNLAEGFHGRNREAQIPALLERLEVPYSGSDAAALAMTLDKSIAKRVAASLGISTPDFWVVDKRKDLAKVPDQFPFFVKPLWQGSSMGIRLSSRVEDRSQLVREVDRLLDAYPHEPVLVEKYVEGSEITVAVLGNDPPEILGMMEVAFRDARKKDFCYSLEVKRNWRHEVDYHSPPRIEKSAEREIRQTALSLFKVLRLRDLARFDFRVSSKGKPYFLEVNPLPGLSPESGDVVILADKKGLKFHELILKIFQTALERYPTLRHSNVKAHSHGA